MLTGRAINTSTAGSLTIISVAPFGDKGAQGKVYQTDKPKYFLKVWEPDGEEDLKRNLVRYHAERTDTEKRLRTFSRLRFLAESELTSLPLEYVHVDDRPGYIMARATGKEMAEEWNSLMQLSLVERMRIAHSLANGISVLHSHQVIHADIRRDNFFFVPQTQSIQVLDIDGGGYWGSEPETDQFPPSVIGIPRYMAPELHRLYGRLKDTRAVWATIWRDSTGRAQPDLWSLAVLIYDIVVDREGPFPQKSTILNRRTWAFDDHPEWPQPEQKAKFKDLGIDRELIDYFTEVFRATNRTRSDFRRPMAANWGAVLRRAIERRQVPSVKCSVCGYAITDIKKIICPQCINKNRVSPLWGWVTCPRGHSTPAKPPHSSVTHYCRECGDILN